MALIDPLKNLNATISTAKQEVERCGNKSDSLSQANEIIIILAKEVQQLLLEIQEL